MVFSAYLMRDFSMQRYFPVGAFVLAAAVVLTSGCADKGIKKINLSGTVTYNGKTLNSGLLKVAGPNNSYTAAAIQKDGTYKITDVIPGEVKIGVMPSPQSSGSSSGGKDAPTTAPIDLPDKLRDPETSGVKYTITPETKELNIELK
jgi:hypothetical protein